MKTVYHLHNERREPSLAMTPMIDVVFLLLIFFVCTASFEAIELTLPTDLLVTGGTAIEAPTEELPELEQVVIKVATMGATIAWTINDAPCTTRTDLVQKLAALASIDRNLPVVLDAASEVPLGQVIDVYDQARLSGFTSIRFAASAE